MISNLLVAMNVFSERNVPELGCKLEAYRLTLNLKGLK
jgi:hypothetical protein